MTEKQIILGFRRCTGGFTRERWDEWKELAKNGMTDEQLEIELKRRIGIMGGGSGHDDCPRHWYQGAGLKIWLGDDMWGRHSTIKPTFEGKKTINMARRIYGIKDPNQLQTELF